jgi:hypothetical protein
MSIICQGITLSGVPCHRKVKNQQYCYQHRQDPYSVKKHRETKPSKCIICYESLANQRNALECGHWIHIKCIINSAKAVCPICRTKLTVGKRAMKCIEKLAKTRETEYLQEEEDELRIDLQYQVAGLIAPALQDRIHEVVGNLLDDTDDIITTDVLTDVFDDDTYQSFLHSLMGYELIESEFFDESDLDSDEYDSA